MTQSQTLQSAKATVVAANNLRPEVAGWSASRILSGLGHPGYGRKFAEDIVLRMAAKGCDAWQAGVMGR